MRNVNIKLILAFTILLVSSCHDDFLKEDPYDFIGPEQFYKTEADAIAGVNSIYDALGGEDAYARHVWMMADYPAIGSTANGSGDPYRTQLENYNWDASMGGIVTVWRSMYKGINRANTILDKVPVITMNEDLKKRLLGEARFLRAYFYFTLIRFWDNVPLVTEPTYILKDFKQSNVGTSDAVWNLIIDDLKAAEVEGVLPVTYPQNELGRATRGAVKGMLAKVYLQKKDWGAAAQKAKEVVDMGVYGLYENFEDAFSLANEHGKENLFSAEFASNIGEGTNIPAMTGVRNGEQIAAEGWSSWTGLKKFLDSYLPNDKRTAKTFTLSYIDKKGQLQTYPNTNMPVGIPHIRKHIDLNDRPASSGDYGINFQILRYADVLLVHSEAVNMASGPSEDAVFGINEVRKRAGLDPLDYTALTKEELRRAIIQEREWELAYEAQAYFDYKRQGVIEEKAAWKGYTATDKHYSFPIPQDEIDRNNNLEQNPGYGGQ